MEKQISKTNRRLGGILIGAWFILLAILFTRPMPNNAEHAIAGEIGDNIYFIWMIGWVRKALFSLGVDPLDVSFLNYPEGWNMAHTEMTPSQLILAQPFCLWKGETFAYNMVMLLSFILSGLIMYAWVRHMTGSTAAGLLSGTVFACLPYRQAHYLIGHLNLSGTQWIPLFFWGWFDMLKEGNGEFRKKPAILAALGLGLTALTSQYYFFMLVIIAAFQGLFVLIFRDRSKWKDPAFWKTCVLFGLIALPICLAAEWPFLTLAGSGEMPDRDWGSVRMYSAGLSDYLLPGTTHFLFGKWVGAHFDRSIWNEATLYVGIFALILFIIGMRRPTKYNWIRPMILCGVITAVILSMGSDLHWNNRAIELTLPAVLQQKLGRETFPILLPGFFFFKFVPFYAKLRAMMRFGIFAECLIAAGAGFGLQFLTERHPGKRVWVTGIAILLVLFDFFPRAQQQFAEIAPREADLWLARQPGDGSVMRYPFELNDDQAGTYYTLYNEKPFIGGFFNAFPTNQYKAIKDVMNGFPSEESLKLARELQVGYVLVEADALEQAIREGTVPWDSSKELYAALAALGLKSSFEAQGIDVFEIGE